MTQIKMLEIDQVLRMLPSRGERISNFHSLIKKFGQEGWRLPPIGVDVYPDVPGGGPRVEGGRTTKSILDAAAQAGVLEVPVELRYHGPESKKTPLKRQRIGAGVLFVIADPGMTPNVLLIRRAGFTEAGTWAIPGGLVDAEETPEQAAFREVREELGSVPRDIWVVEEHFFHGELEENVAFYTTFITRVPASTRETWRIRLDRHEASDWGWFSIDDLPRPLHPGLPPVLVKLDALLSVL